MVREREPQDEFLKFESSRTPEFRRVCEEAEREFEHFLEGALRTSRAFPLLRDHELAALKLPDALLVSRDDEISRRFDDAVEQHANLLVDFRCLAFIRQRNGTRLN